MDTLIDFGSLAIQFINFAVVAYVLRRFFFVPYMKYLDEEVKKRTHLETEIAKSEHILADAHNQAINIVDQAKLDAKIVASEITDNARKEGTEIIARAHADADATRSKGFADIAHERRIIAQELQKKVLDVALQMNAKLFGNTSTQREFLKHNLPSIDL